MYEIFLEWPPSVNNYYVKTRNGVYISSKGRAFREAVSLAVNEQLGGMLKLDEKLEVTVILSPPDRRTRDLDNFMKSLLDAITHAGVWEDDGQIDQLLIYRAKPKSIGKGKSKEGSGCVVRIDTAGPVLSAQQLLDII